MAYFKVLSRLSARVTGVVLKLNVGSLMDLQSALLLVYTRLPTHQKEIKTEEIHVNLSEPNLYSRFLHTGCNDYANVSLIFRHMFMVRRCTT
jgi:ribosomal protein S27E